MNVLDTLTPKKTDQPRLAPGDTVRVHTLIVEGDRERVQVFQGTVIRIRSGGVNANFTVLVPTENPEVGAPDRIDLKAMLQHFLDFRFEVVTRRLQFEL